MPRPREPVNLLVAKGKKHLTKVEIEERLDSEVSAPSDGIEAPAYLTPELQAEFSRIAAQLILSLILCILISGCAKNVSAPESNIASEASAEDQQQDESSPSPTFITLNEAPSPVADEAESPMNATSAPSAQTSPPVVQIPALSPVPSQSQSVTPAPSPSPVNTPEATTYTYSVWAESGAVITLVDSTTGEFHYKQKCDACGEVKNGETLSFARGGSGMIYIATKAMHYFFPHWVQPALWDFQNMCHRMDNIFHHLSNI